MKIETALETVEHVVKDWSKRYSHKITYIGKTANPYYHRCICTLSCPKDAQPVPVAEVKAHFILRESSRGKTSPDSKECDVAVESFRFENESLNYKLNLGFSSINLEFVIDRIIRDKWKIRQLIDLSTEFELSRIIPHPRFNNKISSGVINNGEATADELSSVNLQNCSVSRSQHENSHVCSPSDAKDTKSVLEYDSVSVKNLLANIFQAADEECAGLLSHKEVSDLLQVTTLGLADHDLRVLLAAAPENDQGLIDYRTFVTAAPSIIEDLRTKRAAFIKRTAALPRRHIVTEEAIELCFGDELEETSRLMKGCFENIDSGGTGLISRYDFSRCLINKPERCSPQETSMLLQMLTEDEDTGCVAYLEFPSKLRQLRHEVFNSALIQTDGPDLRQNLMQMLAFNESTDAMTLPIWTIRDILLKANQICFSRMQIHILLCKTKITHCGVVDCQEFLKLACGIIPTMFGSQELMEAADEIARDHAEAAERAELKELQGLTGGAIRSFKNNSNSTKNHHVIAPMYEECEDYDEGEKGAAPDKDTVEKNLIHLFNVMDDMHRGILNIGNFISVLLQSDETEQRSNEVVAQCQLSASEVRGLIAEAVIDENSEIRYAEHIRKWVPILFELRKIRVYERLMQMDPDDLKSSHTT